MALEIDDSAAGVLDRDLPCDRCRYNLRGLGAHGLCPECGLAIASTLAADARERARRPPPSPWLARQVVEGAALGLAALALTCAAGVTPNAWTRLRAPGRTLLLVVFATAWALAMASAWKLTRDDPPLQPRRRPRFFPLATRGVALAWLAGPFWFARETWALPDRGPPLSSLPLYVAAFAGVLLSALLPLRVGWLLARKRCYGSAAVACGVALFAPLVAAFLLPGSGFGPSSLDFLAQSPLPPFGPGELWFVVSRRLSKWKMRNPGEMLLMAVVGAAYALVLVRLTVAYAWPRNR